MPTTTAPLPTVRPRSVSRSRRALATAVLGLEALAGCSFAADVGQDASSSSPSSPGPTGDAEVQDGPRLPVLTLQGLGDLRYGMTPDQASQALGVELVGSEAYAGMRADLGCGYLSPTAGAVPDGLPEGIDVMVTGPGEGVVARVDVSGGAYRTEDGIGIGDDVTAVQAVQPEGVVTEPAPYGDGQQVTVNPLDAAASTAEVFDVDAAGKVTGFRAGRQPEVGSSEGCV